MLPGHLRYHLKARIRSKSQHRTGRCRALLPGGKVCGRGGLHAPPPERLRIRKEPIEAELVLLMERLRHLPPELRPVLLAQVPRRLP